MNGTNLFIVLAIITIFISLILAIFIVLLLPWLRAFLQGSPVSLPHIVAMRLRGTPPTLVIEAYATLKRSGMSTTAANIEKKYLDNKHRIFTSQDLVALVIQKENPGRTTATKNRD